MDLTEANKALSKAKIKLMGKADSVFFTTLCFSMKHLFDEKIPTACAGGMTIRYNPKFFMELTPEEQVFLMLHETMHIAYLHGVRFKALTTEKEHRLWNIAADHVINLQLIKSGFRMPSDDKAGHANKDFEGMSTEEIYKLLMSQPDSGQSSMNDLMPSDGEGDSGASGNSCGLEEKVKDVLVRAALQSKMAGDKPGTIPGEIEIFLDKLLNPKLPWHRILQKYLTAKAKTDYSFQKPNRRFFPDHHLPSVFGEGLCNIAIAVDTSGSVSDADFLQFVSDTHGILRMMKPEQISFIQFDTEIKSVNTVKSVNELEKLKFTGRGGTDVNDITKWANTNKPQVMLVFTDGYFHHPHESTKVDTIWIIHNNPGFTPPFGKAIHYQL